MNQKPVIPSSQPVVFEIDALHVVRRPFVLRQVINPTKHNHMHSHQCHGAYSVPNRILSYSLLSTRTTAVINCGWVRVAGVQPCGCDPLPLPALSCRATDNNCAGDIGRTGAVHSHFRPSARGPRQPG